MDRSTAGTYVPVVDPCFADDSQHMYGYRAKVFAKENGAGRSLCHLIHRRDLFV